MIKADTLVETAAPTGIWFRKFWSIVFGVTGIVSPLAQEGDALATLLRTGSTRPTLSTRSVSHIGGSSRPVNNREGEAEEVPLERFNAYLREEEQADDEAHYDDTQFLDEVEIQYVE